MLRLSPRAWLMVRSRVNSIPLIWRDAPAMASAKVVGITGDESDSTWQARLLSLPHCC